MVQKFKIRAFSALNPSHSLLPNEAYLDVGTDHKKK
jgi:hypothetical protein